MAEICGNFRLRDSKPEKSSVKKLKELKSASISDAARAFNMNVTDFLHYIGKLEREGKLKIKFF